MLLPSKSVSRCVLLWAPCTSIWALLGLVCEALFDTSLPSCLHFSPVSETYACLCYTLPSSAMTLLCLLGGVSLKGSPQPDYCFPPTHLFFSNLDSYPVAWQREYSFLLMGIILASHSGPLHGVLFSFPGLWSTHTFKCPHWGTGKKTPCPHTGLSACHLYLPTKAQHRVFFLWSFSEAPWSCTTASSQFLDFCLWFLSPFTFQSESSLKTESTSCLELHPISGSSLLLMYHLTPPVADNSTVLSLLMEYSL